MPEITRKLDEILRNQTKIMATQADLDTKITELITAQNAEADRVAACQATLQNSLGELKAQLALASGTGVPTDFSPQIARIQTAIDALNNTDPVPAPVVVAVPVDPTGTSPEPVVVETVPPLDPLASSSSSSESSASSQ